MLERLRQTLVESYVGAVALGWLLAGGLMDFVGIFSPPVAFGFRETNCRYLRSILPGRGACACKTGYPN